MTHFIDQGTGLPILILHGWGSSSTRWLPVVDGLVKSGYRLIVPDLPGFGPTAEPTSTWDVDAYTDWTLALLDSLGLDKVTLLGHSFGGRIGIKIASRQGNRLDKLILCAAAGVSSRKSKVESPKVKTFKWAASVGRKILKPLGLAENRWLRKFLHRLAGEHDYADASPMMREVMKKVIAEDLAPLLGLISVPTLLVWGREDRVTPLADGEHMHSCIEGSRLIVYDGVRHGVHLQAPERLVRDVVDFLGSD